MNTVAFTEDPNGSEMIAAGGYLITHIFQLQDDEETNLGQYTHVVQVEDWTEVAPTIDRMLTFPEGAGFTVSVSVNALNAVN